MEGHTSFFDKFKQVLTSDTLAGQKGRIISASQGIQILKGGDNFEIPYYMKFSRHVNFANFAIQKKSRNLSDAKTKYRENNMTRKLSGSHYVDN